MIQSMLQYDGSLTENLDVRYNLPGPYHITEKAMPNLHNKVWNFLSKLLENVRAVSFTIDIWSSDVSPISLLSLTAHWIDLDFTP